MKIKTDEITSVIKKEIEQFSQKLEVSEVGQVVEVGDGIARVYGLSKAMAGELIEFQGSGGKVMGQVMNLELDTVGCVLYGDATSIREGATARATGNLLEVPVAVAQRGLGNPRQQRLHVGPRPVGGIVLEQLPAGIHQRHHARRQRVVRADEDPALLAALMPEGYRALGERATIIDVVGFDWNCPQHITPRFTEAEVLQHVAPLRELVSQVLTFDYLGALVVAVAFPLLLVPHLGLVRTGVFFGLLNAAVAVWALWMFRGELRRLRAHAIACAAVVAVLLGINMYTAFVHFGKRILLPI